VRRRSLLYIVVVGGLWPLVFRRFSPYFGALPGGALRSPAEIWGQLVVFVSSWSSDGGSQMRWRGYSGDSNKGPRSWLPLQGWKLLPFLGRPWRRGRKLNNGEPGVISSPGRPWRRGGLGAGRVAPPLCLEASAVRGAFDLLLLAHAGRHGGGSVCS
jgi:hypothetical protein